MRSRCFFSTSTLHLVSSLSIFSTIDPESSAYIFSTLNRDSKTCVLFFLLQLYFQNECTHIILYKYEHHIFFIKTWFLVENLFSSWFKYKKQGQEFWFFRLRLRSLFFYTPKSKLHFVRFRLPISAPKFFFSDYFRLPTPHLWLLWAEWYPETCLKWSITGFLHGTTA